MRYTQEVKQDAELRNYLYYLDVYELEYYITYSFYNDLSLKETVAIISELDIYEVRKKAKYRIGSTMHIIKAVYELYKELHLCPDFMFEKWQSEIELGFKKIIRKLKEN